MAKERIPIPKRLQRMALIEVGGRCPFEKCTESLMDFHHINGDPSDNRIENIIAICVKHHAEETRLKKYGAPLFREMKRRLQRDAVAWGVDLFPASKLAVEDALEDIARCIDAPLNSAERALAETAIEGLRAAVQSGDYRGTLRQLRAMRRGLRGRREVMRALGPDIFNLAGICFFRVAKLRQSALSYQHGLAWGETWKLHVNFATLLLYNQEPEDALREAEAAHRLNPSSGHGILILASARWETNGRIDQLVVQLRQAIQLEPASVNTRLQLARALSLSGETDEALQLVEAVPGPTHRDPARDALRGVVFQNCAVHALEKLGVVKGGILTTARFTREPIVSHDHPLLVRAIEAFSHATRNAQSDPLFARTGLAHAHMSAGTCQFLRGDELGALRSFCAGERFPKTRDEALANIAQILSARNRHAALKRLYGALPAHVQCLSSIRRWMAGALLETKEAERGTEMLRSLCRQPDAVAADFFNLAIGLALADAPDEELSAAVRRARETGPTEHLDHSIGMTLFIHRECSRSIPYLLAAFVADPSDLMALEFAGKATYATKGVRQAEDLLRAHEGALLAAGGSTTLAVCYMRRGEFEPARRHLINLHRASWAPWDKRYIAEILDCAQLGVSPQVSFGCVQVV